MRKTRKRIKVWCDKCGIKVTRIRHIHPICYVVGLAAPQCLIVAYPWIHAEKHMREWEKENPLNIINIFDKELKAGDWCSIGYIVTNSYSQLVAIPLEGKS